MWVGSKLGPQNQNIISSSKIFQSLIPSSDEVYPGGIGNESHSFSTIVTNNFKIWLDLTIV
jgi:hypothetical protein